MGGAASAPARASARSLASWSLADETAAAAATLAPWRGLAADLAATASTFLPRRDATPPERVGGWLYWSEADADGGIRLLRRRPGGGRTARAPSTDLVLDARRLQAATGASALGEVRLSPDGARVAVTLDAGGDDWSAAVVAVGDGQTLLDRVPRAAAVEWGPTGDLWYVRQDGTGRPAAAFRRRAGSDDARVFAEPDPALLLALAKSKDGRLLTLTSVAPDRAAVRAVDLVEGVGAAAPTPTLVAPPAPGLEAFVEHAPAFGGTLVLTNSVEGAGKAVPQGSDAAEWWLARAPRGAPPAAWAPLLARRAGAAITDIDVFERGILVHERTDAGRAAVSLLKPGGAAPVRIGLPPGARCVKGGANAEFGTKNARLVLSSSLAPDGAVDVCLETGDVSLSRAPGAAAAAAASAAAAAGLAVWDETVGDRVPVTVLGRAGRGRRGGGPTLVCVYGSYGLPLDPAFNPLHLTLALRGWTVALAHVRGGGEKGRAWHAAGRGENRAAAAADAAAALAWATARSGPAVALAAESAGALLVGRLLADHPSSLAAVALRVPFLAPSSDATPGEAGEWGPPGDDLRGVCPTAMLEEAAVAASAAAGPPVLIQASTRDPRAPATSAAAWAARLRVARGPGGAAVLVDAGGAGHAAPGGACGLAREAAAAAFLVASVERGAFRPRAAA